jgi:hypothetical protein
LDWSHQLWKDLNYKSCQEPSSKEFDDWLKHADNPAHARYARFFIPRGDDPILQSMGSPLMHRSHNCLAGDPTGTVAHWKRILELKGISSINNLADITHVMNSNQQLMSSAVATLLHRFWFVGILEHLESVCFSFITRISFYLYPIVFLLCSSLNIYSYDPIL